ncbi:MAG: NAD(+) diphosphatase [Geminicoccaceae bacterium]
MTGPILNSPPHVYDTAGFDRAADRRRDPHWLAERRADPGSRLVLMSALAVPVRGDSAELLVPRVAEVGEVPEDGIFLGLRGEEAWFARAAEAHPLAEARFVELRSVGTLLPAGDAALLAYARGLLHWHARNRFCGVCGTATEVTQAGHARQCPNCHAEHFPRTDPAVIVLVHRGEHCLLGRSARFPTGMYSTLAGFVEPGESLEESLRREVLEEVGIEVETPVYRSSQPWPFPQSLMLGFHAEARTTELTLDADEIEDARWLHRDELLDEERRPVRLPGPDSIARYLIESWLRHG